MSNILDMKITTDMSGKDGVLPVRPPALLRTMDTVVDILPVAQAMHSVSKPYLSIPSLDAVVRSLVEVPEWPTDCLNATREERWELWTMHFISGNDYHLGNDYYSAMDKMDLKYINNKVVIFFGMVGGIVALLTLLRFMDVLIDGNQKWICSVALAALSVSFTMLWKCYLSHLRMTDELKAMHGTIWDTRLAATLMRDDTPAMPSVLVRIAHAIVKGDPKRNAALIRLRSNISIQDHVSMMRLTKKLENSKRVMFGKETSVELDGDTQELCCRVLDALDEEQASRSIETDGPTILRF